MIEEAGWACRPCLPQAQQESAADAGVFEKGKLSSEVTRVCVNLCVLIILPAVIVRPLTTHPYKAETEYVGF